MKVYDEIKQIKKYAFNKKVFLWGAGVLGCASLKKICDIFGNIEGVIDIKASEMGEKINNISLFMPEYVFENYDVSDIYIIVTATGIKSINEIINCCVNKGIDIKKQIYILNNKENVYIDISGKCNLRCKSCQVCNNSNGFIN